VSALAHYFEEAGVPSVATSLIRPQTERVRPPRALWVPFELGRPFGPPGEPAFQRRVVLAALNLLERTDGPVIIENFPEDDPRARPDPRWRPPAATSPSNALAGEIASLDAAHRRFLAAHGRTQLGLSGLSIAEAGEYIGAWSRGDSPASRNAEMSAPLLLRFAVDDMKAYYVEAALADAGRPSAKQIGDWFWNETAAGATLFALRAAHLTSPDERLKAIAGLFLVPGTRVPPVG
jgi:hypothetical protein